LTEAVTERGERLGKARGEKWNFLEGRKSTGVAERRGGAIAQMFRSGTAWTSSGGVGCKTRATTKMGGGVGD